MVLSASGVCKSYGITDILKDVSFGVEEGDKVGILGVNGAGKTTLFRLITGQEQPDAGEIYISRQTGLAYMQQHAEYTSEKTAEEEVLSVFADLIEEEKRLKELEQQLAAEIEHNAIDLVIFLRDPLSPKSHEPDLMDVLRLCDIHNIPLATNVATAELLIKALDRGDLDWREILKS